MAQQKKKSPAKKAASKAKPRTSAAKTGQGAKGKPEEKTSRVGEILLFALGLLLLFLTFVRGESLWKVLHNGLFGSFGTMAYIGWALVLYIAILGSVKKEVALVHKLWQSAVFFVMLCAQVQILFVGLPSTVSFLYQNGVAKKGGGVIGGLLAWPLIKACGRVGAAIIVFLLLFVFFMLISNFTIYGMLRGLFSPIRHMRENRRKKKEEGEKQPPEPTPTPEHPPKRRRPIDVDLGPGFDDVPVDPEKNPEPEPPKKEKKKQPEPEPDIVVPTGSENSASYRFPPEELLQLPVKTSAKTASMEMKESAAKLVDLLRSFGVETTLTGISRGPSITRYELQPSVGVKMNKITALADDIALSMAASGVRIAPIPNKTSIGVEIPNQNTDVVPIREIISTPTFKNNKSKLAVALGLDVSGNTMVADIAKMPHVLIAGATGSGKSVCINSLLISMLYHATPDEVKFLLVDPKVVELGVYNGIPHLLVPVVTDPRKAAGALNWAVTEMLKRYKLFADHGVRDLVGYNRMAERSIDLEPLPQIVIVIDELSDLMMVASAEVQDSISRLAAMARAAGMHLVIATQRPSVDVITGVIKANIPSRIAFAVASQVDSRTILDGSGADKLLGRGDMLFYTPSMSKPVRIQGCFVSDEEIAAVTEFLKAQTQADYDDDVMDEIERQAVKEKKDSSSDGDDLFGEDEMLPDAIEAVLEAGQASTSYLQRRLKVGYARAGRLMDVMEQKGIIGPFEGSKPRPVLIDRQQWLEMKLRISGEQQSLPLTDPQAEDEE